MKPEVPECFHRVSIKALILDETRTKILVSQYPSGKWDLMGGGLEHGEKPADALKREIKEETGLTVTWTNDRPCYFIAAHAMTEDFYYCNVVYEAELADLNFTPSDECATIKFVSIDELKELNTMANLQELARLFDLNNHKK